MTVKKQFQKERKRKIGQHCGKWPKSDEKFEPSIQVVVSIV